MFSFVKSLFLSVPSDDTSSSDLEHEPLSVPHTASKSNRASMSKSSTSSSEDEESVHSEDDNTDVSSEPPEIRSQIAHPEARGHSARKSVLDGSSSAQQHASVVDLSTQQAGSDSHRYKGALYLVEGVEFRCLMEDCEAMVGEATVTFQPADSKTSKRPAPLTVKLSQLTSLRQHLVNAFQFIVRTPQGDGGTEYGFQLSTIESTFRLRMALYGSLVRIATPIIDVECAVAEYDTKAREFVILSKSATVQLLASPSGRDYYLTVADEQSLSAAGSSPTERNFFFVDYLSKEMQIWPSPSTNQITFWGVHYRKLDVAKTMFMLEIDPASVGEASTNIFFEKLAIILQDRSFVRSKRESNGGEEDIFMEDDGFDVGRLTDESTHREWKGGRSSTCHRRSSYYDAETGGSDGDDDDDNDQQLYNPGVYPMYSSNVSSDTLVHRFMEVGTDRTFVCRGDLSDPFTRSSMHHSKHDASRLQLKVYKKEEGAGEDVLESVGVIDGKKFSYKGQTFAPSKGLLHQQEKKLLLVPEGDTEGKVFMMDLEAESVVQQWDADNTAISTMFPTFKKGQASLDPTFLCANPRQLFLMDTRANNGCAKATSYAYSTNPQLTVGATDNEGHILVGSRLGELRLFDGTANAKGDFKRAKTLLQTIKEPITAVDVNRDGSWILATTKTFLVVFPTRLAGSTKTGFETALGQQKPAPRYLMLTAEDMVKYQITDITFAPAKFDAEEESIVTSTGNMAVVWDFGTVKRGKPFYSVRFAEDSIKDVQITADSSNVVVAYPTAIGLFGTEKRRVEGV